MREVFAAAVAAMGLGTLGAVVMGAAGPEPARALLAGGFIAWATFGAAAGRIGRRTP